MAKRSLRFGIHDGFTRRAATWKVWTETANGNSDVYLACRALGGSLKASLHQSGSWHIAIRQEHLNKMLIDKRYDASRHFGRSLAFSEIVANRTICHL